MKICGMYLNFRKHKSTRPRVRMGRTKLANLQKEVQFLGLTKYGNYTRLR